VTFSCLSDLYYDLEPVHLLKRILSFKSKIDTQVSFLIIHFTLLVCIL
jgi:hypothetical protein